MRFLRQRRYNKRSNQTGHSGGIALLIEELHNKERKRGEKELRKDSRSLLRERIFGLRSSNQPLGEYNRLKIESTCP